MAWVLVTGQTASLNNATTITPTVAVPNVIGSGNIYLGAVGYDSAQTLNSVTDDKGNTYNLKSTITETTDLIKITQFELGNITNGPKTITLHFSAATDSCAVVAEFSGGLAAADPNDGTTGQFQAAVASGANNVTSTAIVTTVDGDLIVGASLDGASTTAPTTGTSPSAFISIGTASDATTIFAIRLEYFVQTTHGSIAATFGIGVNGDSAATNVVALKPSAGAATVNAIDPVEWRRLAQKWHTAYASQYTAFVPLAKEDVARLEWTNLWEGPVRFKPALPVGDHPFLAFVKAAPFPETVTEDRWHRPWLEPVRRISGHAAVQQFLALPVPASQDIPKYEWTLLWQDPVRSKQGLPPNQQPFLAFTPPQVAAATGGNILWYSPWSSVMTVTILIGEG